MATNTLSPKPMALIILDGWGHSDSIEYNPIRTTNTPTFDQLFRDYPYTLLAASGTAVGLPEGQMGNSEVGHLHVGAGRKVPQDLTRIKQDIQNGTFKQNPTLTAAINKAKQHHRAVHILGLLSPGGVHSHEQQIIAVIEAIAEQGVTQQYLHAFLDGRDTPPQSAAASLQKIDALYQQLPGGKIASVIGRYYAMDRDNRWERIQKAYDLLTIGQNCHQANTAEAALQMAYARGETDEFVQATTIADASTPPITVQDGDVIIFMNFRADRARQLSHAFLDTEFTGFTRHQQPKLTTFVSLTAYAKNLPTQVAYPPLQISNTLGEYLATQEKKQLRIAETEKYAHVTYFLNGGTETSFAGEERKLIASPKVATYDLKPEMSAIELTDALVDAIENQHFDAIICNYANPDMVGHTGNNDAAHTAVATIDQCINRVVSSLKKVGGEALITADHGNIEVMYNEQTGQPHTAHTCNLVPLIYVGRKAHFNNQQGSLDDIAPTMLYLMGLEQPMEMTGTNLMVLESE